MERIWVDPPAADQEGGLALLDEGVITLRQHTHRGEYFF